MAFDDRTAEVKSDQELFLSKIRQAISILRSYGSELALGSEGIEYKDSENICELPVVGTIFAWLADEFQDVGAKPLETVGDVMTHLGVTCDRLKGYRDSSDRHAMQRVAHIIGCHCHGGQYISGDAAADRLEEAAKTVFC